MIQNYSFEIFAVEVFLFCIFMVVILKTASDYFRIGTDFTAWKCLITWIHRIRPYLPIDPSIVSVKFFLNFVKNWKVKKVFINFDSCIFLNICRFFETWFYSLWFSLLKQISKNEFYIFLTFCMLGGVCAWGGRKKLLYLPKPNI